MRTNGQGGKTSLGRSLWQTRGMAVTPQFGAPMILASPSRLSLKHFVHRVDATFAVGRLRKAGPMLYSRGRIIHYRPGWLKKDHLPFAKGSYEPRPAAWLTVASRRLGGKRRLPQPASAHQHLAITFERACCSFAATNVR
jgi:hypothetical protein